MKRSELSYLRPLPSSFFQQSTVAIAHGLIGKGIFRTIRGCEVLVRIVETEAYLSRVDPASHSFRGISKRNRSMFGPAGTCYVYLSYGMHYCMNVVTARAGVGEAVLLRAAIPVFGHSRIAVNRVGVAPVNWLNGPGKLTRALEIDWAFDGARFKKPDLALVDLGILHSRVITTPRIGISKAKTLPLRFVEEPISNHRLRAKI